jgi:hypothetical protein
MWKTRKINDQTPTDKNRITKENPQSLLLQRPGQEKLPNLIGLGTLFSCTNISFLG